MLVRVGPADALRHVSKRALSGVRVSIERRQLKILFLAEVHGDQCVKAVQQLLQTIDVRDGGVRQLLDPGDDRLVVVNHGNGCVREADELGPLGVEDGLLRPRVRDQRALQEGKDPTTQALSLVLGDPGHFTRRYAEMLYVLQQLLMLAAERFSGSHEVTVGLGFVTCIRS